MTDKEENGEVKKKASPPSKKVRILNGRKVGRFFIDTDLPLEPGSSAMVERKLAEYLVALGGVIIEEDEVWQGKI